MNVLLLVMLHVDVGFYLLRLFLVALWSPAGKGLTSWLSCSLCFDLFFQICPGPHQN